MFKCKVSLGMLPTKPGIRICNYINNYDFLCFLVHAVQLVKVISLKSSNFILRNLRFLWHIETKKAYSCSIWDFAMNSKIKEKTS